MARRSLYFRIAVVLATAAAGCAAIEGLDKYSAGGAKEAGVDATVAPPDGADDSGPPGVDAGAQDGSAVPDGPDSPVGVDVTPPPFDAGSCQTSVDLVHGVFVMPGGVDGFGCGQSPASPCASISNAIVSASSLGGRNIVYVAAGTYLEKLNLVPGVTVQGGWHVAAGADGGVWSFDCTSTTPYSDVIVQAPMTSNITVLADGFTGTAGLSTLTVLSKPASSVQPGESLYGIFARGASVMLTLTDVVVTMQSAGDGPQGAAGDAGAPAPSAPCPSDAGTGTTGSPGPGADAGSFSSAGFVPHTGGAGGVGGVGTNGQPGAAGMSAPYTACTGTLPCQQATQQCVGGVGLSGCGGSGGLGGTGGTGGGSSVALFAYDAIVTVTAGAYAAGSGGAGAFGGNGGQGGIGSQGTTGFPTSCPSTACSDAGACRTVPPVVATGGGAGTMGGTGAAGGRGGAGCGGDSYAIVTGGRATAALTLSMSPFAPALYAGTAGASKDNGAAGTAGTTTTF